LNQSNKKKIITRIIQKQTLEKEMMKFNPTKQALIEKITMLNK
jgi:hypothetical protein